MNKIKTSQKRLQCGSKILDLSKPAVMAVLNLTPDSFSDGGNVFSQAQVDPSKVLTTVSKMIDDGADIIDLGGESTRPGAKPVSVQQELDRVIPVLNSLTANFDSVFSVDTSTPEVMKEAASAGAHIINDISGGLYDANMFKTIAALNVPYVLMHVNDNKDEMHTVKNEASIMPVLHNFFTTTCATAKEVGIQQLILDPGFGFSKTPEQNFEIISNLSAFASFQKPLLIGVSRKSTIYKTLGITASEALNGTTVLHTAALLHGASILRVHDVKEANEVVTLCSYLQ